MLNKRFTILARVLSFLILATLFSGCIEQEPINEKPFVAIDYPSDSATVSGILMVRGTADDPDGNDTLLKVEVRVDNGEWETAYGAKKWSFEIDTTVYDDGEHEVYARVSDGELYSETSTVTVFIKNEDRYQNVHRWAVFVATANRPDIDVKLGNGGLYLAEDMAKYFISSYNYPANHITILFDDGWIRTNNGEGERVTTLQERTDRVSGVSYGAATIDNIEQVFTRVIETANLYDDSEVFIWMFSHGVGDIENRITGGKVLERSEILVWDDVIADNELGEMLSLLHTKLCLIVDACYSGGFANRVVLNLPTLLRSNVPANGRIVITGASKFTAGYASTISGPLFTQLWFTGIKTGEADGFKEGVFARGRPTHLRLFKDGKVSVEEAFYFARHMLTTKEFKEYWCMQPQINDRYPASPPLKNRGEMLLGT